MAVDAGLIRATANHDRKVLGWLHKIEATDTIVLRLANKLADDAERMRAGRKPVIDAARVRVQMNAGIRTWRALSAESEDTARLTEPSARSTTEDGRSSPTGRRWSSSTPSSGRSFVLQHRGSDAFRFALVWAIGFECLLDPAFRREHGITAPWADLAAWIRIEADLASYDGTMDLAGRGVGSFDAILGPHTDSDDAAGLDAAYEWLVATMPVAGSA